MTSQSVKKIARERAPLPEKLFYKIGEVSQLLDIESYVLRYWETEFPFLKPRKSSSGQRVYTRKDLDVILQLKQLLYEERYTIEGVRKKFGEAEPLQPPQRTSSDQLSSKEIIDNVKKKLRKILGQIR